MRLRSTVISAALCASLAFAVDARAEARKFALAMMHFNVQYVAGGVVGFGGADSERTPEQIEDLIIVESLEPILDLFLAHPTWGQDIEMQGYMLEVIGQRHPVVLDKLKKLVASGQIDVDAFHYSDQLFIAYPKLDWDRSQTLNADTFARFEIRRGTTVFCQEGQAGPGLALPMKEHGYSVLVFPPNLWKKEHDPTEPAPLYRFGDVRMIVGKDAVTTIGSDTVEAKWTFLDDGELLATDGKNPYVVSGFRKTDAAMKVYETQLAKLESDGYAITPVARYVEALEAKGVAAVDPPPLLDGTWQPQSTDSTFKWTGGRGIWIQDERDNDVRTIAAIGHRELLVAETLAAKAGVAAKEELTQAWRLLVLGQVSDGSGINPIRGEIEYALSHVAEALRIARDVIARAKSALGANAVAVAVDTESGQIGVGETAPAGGRSVAEGPLVPIIDAPERETHVSWAELEPGHFVMTVSLSPSDARTVRIRFPGALEDIFYTPALTSTPVRVPRGAFTFDEVTLPLSDGLIGLGGGLHVVKDQAFVHLGAAITTTSGEVVFADETVPAGETATWKFHIVRGSDEAAANVARKLNVSPKVWR